MKEAQKDEPGPKRRIKLSPKSQMQENHEGIKSPGSLKPRQRSIQKIKKERKPRQGIKGQDPQQPSRGADPFKHKDKGRQGQLEGKRQKKEIRNKKRQ